MSTEELITLTEAAASLPRRSGRKFSASTIWRWHVRGLRGVYLEARRIGGHLYTTRAWLEAFLKESTEQFRRQCTEKDGSVARKGRARKRLEQAGVMGKPNRRGRPPAAPEQRTAE